MYDDILLEQAQLWDMVKEAAFGAEGSITAKPDKFSDMTNYQRQLLARGRYGKDSAGKKLERSDTDFSRMDRARAMAGRATGFYDIGSGRRVLRARADTYKGMDEAGRKAFDKIKTRDAAKNITAEQAKLLRRALIKGKGSLTAGEMTALEGILKVHPGDSIAGKYLSEMQRKVGRGLVMRGAGKAGLVAGGLGAAGYGLSKMSSYDPVVEYVHDMDGLEFAAEAEARAAEILLENGIDPETFEPCYPEHVKIASFPEVGDAVTYEGDAELAEYNEMLDDAALDILEALGF